MARRLGTTNELDVIFALAGTDRGRPAPYLERARAGGGGGAGHAGRLRGLGRLADSVVFIRQGVPWRCAPLVAGRAAPDRPPRVYYAASDQNYRRARAEDRFAGDLDSASATSHAAEVATCGAPADGYLLFDDGSSRAWRESGRSFLIFAAVIGSIALIGFLTALRMRSPRA